MEDSKRRKERDTSSSRRIITRSISRERYGRAVNVIVKDIVDDILGRLPLKELVRLKCVCKEWYSAIPRISKSVRGPRKIIVSSPSCRSLMIFDHEAAAAAVDDEVNNTGTTKRKVQRTRLHLDAPGDVAGSSNGLLLIDFERKKERFVLWNPLIKEHKTLPDLPPSRKMLNFFYVEWIGFGHDGCSDDYKIVRFLAFEDSSFEVLVYSLKTNSWRKLELEQPFSSNKIYVVVNSTQRMGTLVNGALYWPVTVSDVDGNRFQILRFHLADEKLCWMQPPDKVHHEERILRLMVYQGNKLCACQTLFRIHMWVLNENQETESEWTALMSIPPRVSKITNRVEKTIAPLSFMRDGEVLLGCKEPSGIKGCRLYNPKDQSFKWLENLGIEGWFYKQFTYEESIESLAPYNGTRER
ncbi:hypothetical protein FNV43_RR00905 [Rhamnella rubrinervis]|uniref:F-box domain-containing protein n=1 Tax=Rhamnella rubrinervis TaxID=2594499 RepID=A0A8K0HR93_9ROSA|nr:hypothetical protein FNV43_RR00905 [Rhamnella rubrinervis]